MRTKEDNSNARSVDQTFNMFGVLLNFLVTRAETGHEVSFFKGILPPGVVIPLHSHAEFVSAGHPPVLHLRKDTVRHESATGIPLGVFDGVRFPSRRISLDPGDMLLLYTDGLTESCNSAEEEYGFRRIKRVAAQHLRTTPSKLISECLSDHRSFQSGAKQVDDLTLLVIRRTG